MKMLEESLPSIWASMHSWFTPTVLFILINVVIGTIAFSSSQKEENQDNPNPKRHLTRTSSILQRLKSFNLRRQNAEETPPTITTVEPRATDVVETVESVQVPSDSGDDESHFTRSQSDAHPTVEERPQQMMKRSESAKPKLEASEWDEEMAVPEARRPATMKEGRAIGDDEEVDARADDFINKFKQQLKLQQMDPILRRR